MIKKITNYVPEVQANGYESRGFVSEADALSLELETMKAFKKLRINIFTHKQIL